MKPTVVPFAVRIQHKCYEKSWAVCLGATKGAC